jgi:signal transduction histidine kinase
VLENLYNNVAKYAMPNSRVYVDLVDLDAEVKFSIKNISEQRLNIEAKDLTERFIRGDISRSTEGSGLGLSIAKNLTELQGGKFHVYLDGDLFRVTITFPKLEALPEDMSINLLEENIEASLEKSLEESEEKE